MKFDWKPVSIVYLLAAFLVAAFVLSVKFQLPFVFRPAQVHQEANADAYNAASLVDGAISSVGIGFQLQVLAPSVNDPERKFELIPYTDLVSYVRDDNQQLDVTKVCIDSIDLISDEVFQYVSNDVFHFLQEPLCHEYTEDDWFGDYAYAAGNGQTYLLTNHWYVELPYQDVKPFMIDYPNVVGYNFWFPYDDFTMDLNIQAQTSITLSDGTVKTEIVPIYYDWKLQTSSSRPWDITMRNTILQNSENTSDINIRDNFKPGYYQWTQITFRRAPLYLFAFPVLLIAMVILISLIPLMVNSSLEGILGVQTGLLFATFALRSILSPGNEIGQTLIDVSVIGLNLLQVFAVIVLFVRIIQKKRSARK